MLPPYATCIKCSPISALLQIPSSPIPNPFKPHSSEEEAQGYRDRLVDDAADTFLEGIDSEHGSASENVAKLTKRRVNLLQKGLKLEEEKSYYVHSTSSQNVTVADSDYQGVLIPEENDAAHSDDCSDTDDEAVLPREYYTNIIWL